MRNGPRYPSDLRDGEWALIEPMIPAARGGGRPRTTCLRAVMDAILYIASSGCAWRMLPKCFPPISTVRGYFYAWRDSGLLTTINHLLVMAARQQAGREASPSAGVNSHEFSRRPRVSSSAAVRTPRATASRFSHACASGCRTSRCSRTHPVGPRCEFCRPVAVSAPA